MKKGFRFFVSLMLAVALVCGTAGSLAEGTLDTLLPDISLEDRSVLDGITLSDAGTTGETNAEEPAAEVPVEGIGDLETILPSLGDSSVLDAIVLPDAGITEENPAYTAGDIVIFGRYPQTEEGTDETPIEWIVLEVDGENHRALLISKYALDAVPYNTEDTDITWETCTLRAWLNDDFMNRAFSAEEQSAILLTDVDNSDAQGYTGWASGGNNTQDRIFLLSYAEANRYFNVRLHSDNTASRAISTAYAIRRGADAGRNTPVLWWLRSPGSEQDGVASVSKYGTLCISLLNYAGGCIRPALWISTESGFFRLDGTASGSDRQADAEAFVFRNGITWGMSREEVIGREGDVYDESGMNGILELTYRSVQISQYSGDMGCIFSADDASGYALQLCIYTLRDVEQDAFDYLMTAYDSKYGEHREADLQDLVDICGRIDPNFTIGGNPQNYSFCRWDTGDGTGIWMLWGDFANGVVNIFYVSPAFLNATEEGPDLTGI